MSADAERFAHLAEAIDAVLAQTNPEAMLRWLADHGDRWPSASDYTVRQLVDRVLTLALLECRILYGDPGAEPAPTAVLNVKTIAEWSPVTTRSLSDAERRQFRGIIDDELRSDLDAQAPSRRPHQVIDASDLDEPAP